VLNEEEIHLKWRCHRC